MYISSREQKIIYRLIETLSQTLDCEKVRQSTGQILLDLLESDYFASFVWNNTQGKFDKAVSINMDSTNLLNYETYYQDHDPITHKLRLKRSATRVNDIMPQRELMKTEFYNDFLAIDGLHYGINLYAYDNSENIGDFRIWRKKGHSNFDDKSIYILNLIKPYFCNAMRNIRHYEKALNLEQCNKLEDNEVSVEKIMHKFMLTQREAQITLELLQGNKDAEIAEKLFIAFSTLRTHIKHIFQKLEVNSRTLLINKIINSM